MALSLLEPYVIQRVHSIVKGVNRYSSIRVGYLPLLDAAPLIMAQELGIFSNFGIRVQLVKSPDWADIRDKIAIGEIEAAHSLSSLPFTIAKGLGCLAYPTLVPMIFSAHGNCITLSNSLRNRGITDSVTLARAIKGDAETKRFTFGTVFPYSTHSYLLRKWLKSGGVDPDHGVRVVVVPPQQMPADLKAGNIDGYCVGEPYNSVAVLENFGWCPVISAHLEPSHPEKVLMSRLDFVKQRGQEHLALVAGIIQAGIFCENRKNRDLLIQTLSQPKYLNISPKLLHNSLSGEFDCGHGRKIVRDDFILFHRFDTNVPSIEKGVRILDQIRNSGARLAEDLLSEAMVNRIFRPDLYEAAMKMHPSPLLFNSVNIRTIGFDN